MSGHDVSFVTSRAVGERSRSVVRRTTAGLVVGADRRTRRCAGDLFLADAGRPVAIQVTAGFAVTHGEVHGCHVTATTVAQRAVNLSRFMGCCQRPVGRPSAERSPAGASATGCRSRGSAQRPPAELGRHRRCLRGTGGLRPGGEQRWFPVGSRRPAGVRHEPEAGREPHAGHDASRGIRPWADVVSDVGACGRPEVPRGSAGGCAPAESRRPERVAGG